MNIAVTRITSPIEEANQENQEGAQSLCYWKCWEPRKLGAIQIGLNNISSRSIFGAKKLFYKLIGGDNRFTGVGKPRFERA